MYNHLDTLGMIYMPEPLNRNHPLMRGRIASWMVIPGLDGGSRWYDLVGVNHVVIETGTGKWTGQALSNITSPGGFGSWDNNKNNSAVNTAPNANVQGPPISFRAWVRVTTAGSYQWVFTGSGNHGGFGLGGGTGSCLTYYWEGNEYDFNSGLIPNPNEWTLVVVSINSTAATIYMIDSRGVASATNTKTHNNYTATAYYIGASATSSSQLWKGQFNDLAIYNREVFAQEARQYYDICRSGYPGIINRWPSRMLESSAGGAAWVKTLSETYALTDSRLASAGKSLAETYALTDARVMAVAKSLVETLSLTDVRSASLSRILTETLSLIDNLTSGAAWSKILTETLAFTDNRTSRAGKGLAENYGLSDIRTAAVQKVLTETLVLTDARAAGLARRLAETYNLTDVAAAQIVSAAMLIIVTVGAYTDLVTIGQGGIA
jgi:hypothetical protein